MLHNLLAFLHRPIVAMGLLAAITLFLTGQILYTTGSYIFSGQYYFEKVTSLFHLQRLHSPELFPGDYLADYASAVFTPPWLYKAIITGWVRLFGEIDILLRIIIPISSFLMFIGPLIRTGYHLGNALHGWATGLLATLFFVLWYHFLSSYEQAFALPLLAFTAHALVRQRVKTLLLLCIIAPLVYVPVAPIIGVSTAWLLLAMPQKYLTPPLLHWSFWPRFTITAVVGSICLTLCAIGLKPTFTDHPVYGERVNYVDTVTYPEADAEHGRVPTAGWDGFLQFTFGRLFHHLMFYTFDGGVSFPPPGYAMAATLLLALCGFLLWPCQQAVFSGVARLKPLVVGMLFITGLSLVVVLNMAYRFLHYPLYILIILLWPLLLNTLSQSRHLKSTRQYLGQPLLFVLLVLASTSVLSHKVDMRTLFPNWTTYLTTPDKRAAIAFAKTTPVDTLFAAWPKKAGESLPYLAQRSSLVIAKYYHLTYHDHLLHMRARTKALLEAYFATTPAPLITLHHTWGVDYLIYEKAVLAYDTNPQAATYHAPFHGYLETVKKTIPPAELVAFNLPPSAVVLENTEFIVLDLEQLTRNIAPQKIDHNAATK